jgi:hypothetical protein
VRSSFLLGLLDIRRRRSEGVDVKGQGVSKHEMIWVGRRDEDAFCYDSPLLLVKRLPNAWKGRRRGGEKKGEEEMGEGR